MLLLLPYVIDQETEMTKNYSKLLKMYYDLNVFVFP